MIDQYIRKARQGKDTKQMAKAIFEALATAGPVSTTPLEIDGEIVPAETVKAYTVRALVEAGGGGFVKIITSYKHDGKPSRRLLGGATEPGGEVYPLSGIVESLSAGGDLPKPAQADPDEEVRQVRGRSKALWFAFKPSPIRAGDPREVVCQLNRHTKQEDPNRQRSQEEDTRRLEETHALPVFVTARRKQDTEDRQEGVSEARLVLQFLALLGETPTKQDQREAEKAEARENGDGVRSIDTREVRAVKVRGKVIEFA